MILPDCWKLRHKEGLCRADVIRGYFIGIGKWTPEEDIKFLKDWPQLEPAFKPEAYNEYDEENGTCVVCGVKRASKEMEEVVDEMIKGEQK